MNRTLALLAILGCGAGDTWTGTVYPDADDLKDSVTIGEFPTLEACRASCQESLESMSATSRGDYECGRNCRKMFPSLPDSVLVCEETLR